MKKRILAIALALAVMLVSLPVLPINIGGINAGATAAPGDLDLKPLDWPKWTQDRLIHDFEGLTTDGTISNENGTVNIGIGSGQPTNAEVSGLGYRDQYVGYTESSNNVVTLDGKNLVSTLTSDGWFDFCIHMSSVAGHTYGIQFPSANSKYLQLKVDLTGVTSKAAGSKVPFEIQMIISPGHSGHFTGYSEPNVDFFYIPDPTEENPNPEMQVLKTDGQSYHGQVWGYAGQSGTIIVSIDFWDTKGYANFNGNTSIQTIPSYSGVGHRQRSALQIQSENINFAAGDVFKVDSLSWLMNYPINYDYENTFNDFDNYTLGYNANIPWGNIQAYSTPSGQIGCDANHIAIKDGRLAFTPNETATDGTRYTTTIELNNGTGKVYVDETAKALVFDLDVSELTGSKWIRYDIAGQYFNNQAGTSSWWGVYGGIGEIYYIWDNGDVYNAYIGDDTGDTHEIPAGFKGKVVIPFEAITRDSGVEELWSTNYEEVSLRLEMSDWKAVDNGKSYYVDNMGFYSNALGLEEGAGIDFSMLENAMYETGTINGNIRTVEAWIKTTATVDQMFIAEKYDGAISNPTHIEDVQFTNDEPAEGEKPYGKDIVSKSPGFRVGMTAAGNPYFFMADEKCNFINFTCTDAVINDGEWKHVAFVIDETMNEIRCYVNGANVGYQSFVSPTDESVIYKIPENDLFFPITIGNRMPNNARNEVPFNGTIANVRIWSDVRTGAELYNNSAKSVGADAEDLIAEWMLTGENFTAETTGTYDLTEYQWDITSENPLYADYNHDAAEDEFTIVFMPDTQIVNHYSAEQYAAMYQWILDNQERLNIKVVMGLGDIVDQNSETVQWQNAQAAHNNLTANGMPWVIATGNHDYSSLGKREYANFKKYFTTDMLVSNDYFQLGATYTSGDLSSAYYFFTPNGEDGVKYLLLTLETEPRAEVLDWARQIIGNHSDYRVIITTHEYMNAQNRIFTHDTKDMYTGSSSGEQIWNGLLKDYENIDMIVCGHSSFSGIINRVAQGENGNDVYQILCDTQQIDYAYNYAAAVLIGRFKNDGSEVSFNLYSTNADSFMGTENNNLTLDLGSAEDELVDDLVTDNYGAIEGMFHSQSIQRDYNYFSSTTEFKGNGYNNAHTQEKDTVLKATWNNGSIKATATLDGKANYKDGVQTTTGQTEGYWGFGLLKLPATVKGDGTTAVAFHVDGSGLSKNRAFRMFFDTDGDGSWEINTESKATTYYTMSDDNPGVYTKNTANSVVYINKDFKGYIIFPLINEKNGNTDAEAYKADTANDKAQLRFQGYYGFENTTGDYLILDEYSFLQGGPIAVDFKDYDDKVLSTIITEPGQDITSKAPSDPSRHGYKFAGWENIELPDAYEALGVKALYTKDTETTYEVAPKPEVEVDVNVILPAGQDKPYYNDRITISAPKVNAEGQKFSHWMVNGAKFSTSARLSFLVFDELEMVPVYADEVEETPVLVYTNPSRNYVIKNGKWNFQIMGVVEAGEAEVTEIGVLLSASEKTAAELKAGYEANDGTVVKQAVSGAANGRQFLFTFTGIAFDRTRCATTYAIIDGKMVIGDAVTCITIDANGALAE